MTDDILLHYFPYWASVLLMMVGFYTVISGYNLVKKLVGLLMFQTSALLLYIALGFVKGGAAPILKPGVDIYMNPLPHVLMLTGIVVGIGTFALGLALIVRIREAYGTVEEDEILAEDNREAKAIASEHKKLHVTIRKKSDTHTVTRKLDVKMPKRKGRGN